MKSGKQKIRVIVKIINIFEIVSKCVPCNPQTKRFLLCLNDKWEIAATNKATY